MKRPVRASFSIRAQQRADSRLVDPLLVSEKMRPFVTRIRLYTDKVNVSDPTTASQSREEMKAILAKKKILGDKAMRAIAQSVAIAADHQLQGLRQIDDQRDRQRSAADVEKLIERLTQLAEAIARLSPVSKKRLNASVAVYAEEFFDTETFTTIIRAIADALPKIAPKRLAQDVLDAINRPGAGGIHTSPPEIVELWETMSAETRRQIEQKVRSSVARRSATEFLRQLVSLLVKFFPQARPGRLPTIQRHYIERIAKIWQTLGLRIGLAYDGMNCRSIESNFQRYCRAALAAVGDDSKISGRQVTQIKSDIKRRARTHKSGSVKAAR